MYLADIFPKAEVTASHCVDHIFRNSPSASAPTFLLTVTVHTATAAEVLDRLFKEPSLGIATPIIDPGARKANTAADL